MKSIYIATTLMFAIPAFAELSVKLRSQECVSRTVEEETTAKGKIVSEYTTSGVAQAERTFDSDRPDWSLAKSKGERKTERTVTDEAGNVSHKVMREYTFERTMESTLSELGNNLFREVYSTNLKMWAKPGYDFGQDGNYREVNSSSDSIYFDDGRFYHAVSYKDNGVDVPMEKIVYEYAATQDGDVTTTVNRLVEPYIDPSMPQLRVLVEETVCKVRKLN